MGATLDDGPDAHACCIHLLPPAVQNQIIVIVILVFDKCRTDGKDIVSDQVADSFADGNDSVFVALAASDVDVTGYAN